MTISCLGSHSFIEIPNQTTGELERPRSWPHHPNRVTSVMVTPLRVILPDRPTVRVIRDKGIAVLGRGRGVS